MIHKDHFLKRKTFFLTLFLFFIFFQFSFSQTTEFNCGVENTSRSITDKLWSSRMTNSTTNELKPNNEYVIPVVVHIFHLGEDIGVGTNVSYADINTKIEELNAIFRKDVGDEDGVDLEISFCLAVRDPDGNSTDGVVRIDASDVPGYAQYGSGLSPAASTVNMRSDSNWPNTDYMNIWIMHKVSYPTAMNPEAAGTSSVPTPAGITVAFDNPSGIYAHEAAHWLMIRHTFAGDKINGVIICPPNDNPYTDGDAVCDTQPHKRNHNSATHCSYNNLNDCNYPVIWENSYRNYMSYFGTYGRFTQGQKERMHFSLEENPYLNPILSSLGCTPVVEDCLEVEIHDLYCINQGTSNPADDYWHFTMTVTDNSGEGVYWTTSGEVLENGPYGTVKWAWPAGGNIIDNPCYTFTVFDAYNQACRTEVTVCAPSDCSGSAILYPNPVHDVLSVKGSNGIVKITVLDAFGEFQFASKPGFQEDTIYRLPIHQLQAGFYFIKLHLENGIVFTERILKLK